MEEQTERIDEVYYSDLENVCRICLSKDEVKPLTTLIYDNILLSDMYMNYTNLKIDEDDKLPQSICVTCITDMIKVHNFLEKCKTTNNILLEVIKDHKVTVKTEFDVDENCEEVEEYVYVSMENEHDYDIKAVDEDLLRTLSDDVKEEVIKVERKKRKCNSKEDYRKTFICDICGMGFIDEKKFGQHIKSHTGETPLKCEYCNKEFKSRVTYEHHIVEHKMENGEVEIPVKILCEICNEEFSSEYELTNHEITHGKKYYQCDECDKKYFTTLAFESHKKTHDGYKPFTCTQCDKSFTQFALLKRHFFVHTGHKPFSCDVCYRTFSQNAHLKTHFKTHTGERPYLCPHCNKAFALNGNLKVHIRTHTGETPFLCDICGKGFYHSSTMKKHRITHIKPHRTV